MVLRVPLTRRQFGSGLAAATASVPLLGAIPVRALAGAGEATATPGAADVWLKLDALTQEAIKLGLEPPKFRLGPATVTADFRDVAPAILDFMSQVDASVKEVQQTRGLSAPDAESILDRASDLLIEATENERAPRELEEDEEDPQTRSLRAAPYPVIPPLSEIAGEYRELFASCKIRPERAATINDFANRMLDPANRKRYEKIYEETCIPWYFVAGIHALEATFNFRTHLHNGDSLKARTHNIPPNRPPEWNPPNEWEASAIDALTMKKYDKETSWTLPEICYRWEKYNGVRSRMEHNIHTPYLWSFSQHYTKGKFVRDNVWSDDAVSQQPGAAVLLRKLVDMGAVTLPAG
jgi:lysozyme family protein